MYARTYLDYDYPSNAGDGEFTTKWFNQPGQAHMPSKKEGKYRD
jgi:hypothetical protein